MGLSKDLQAVVNDYPEGITALQARQYFPAKKHNIISVVLSAWKKRGYLGVKKSPCPHCANTMNVYVTTPIWPPRMGRKAKTPTEGISAGENVSRL